MKYLPLGLSNFRTIIEEDYLYVDKTRIIYDLFKKKRLFFLSRPRRFGKSLLISTLSEWFSGNKDLFKNTWIGKQSDYEWVKYPVISLDFSTMSCNTSAEFKIDLSRQLETIGEQEGVDITNEPTINTKFRALIKNLSKQNKVVFLVDEYDSPLLENLDNLKIASGILKVMRTFFKNLKDFEKLGYLQAVFITGVTRFSKTSLFSGLNSLEDLSMASEAANLLGYTKEEVLESFDEYIKEFADEENVSQAVITDKIQTFYNGYRFSPNNSKVFNPNSVMQCFDKKTFRNFWFETGTPSFLIQLIKKQPDIVKNIDDAWISRSSLGTFDIGTIDIASILFQTGYLTIRDYQKESKNYLLDWPNIEVKESFYKCIVALYINKSRYLASKPSLPINSSLRQDNP